MKCCPWGEVHLPCPHHFTQIYMPSIPRHKICKKYQYEMRYPTGRHISCQVLYYCKQADVWSDVPPAPYERLSWPSLVLHPAGWPQAETSCGHVSQLLSHRPDVPPPLVETPNGQVWYYCEQAGLRSEVPPTWDVRVGLHLVRCQVRSTSCQMYPQLKRSSGHGKLIDPHGQILHHERPFTWEGNYLVILLPVMVIPSIITILSLNDQYSCCSFCSLAVIDGQTCSMYSDSMHRYS